MIESHLFLAFASQLFSGKDSLFTFQWQNCSIFGGNIQYYMEGKEKARNKMAKKWKRRIKEDL